MRLQGSGHILAFKGSIQSEQAGNLETPRNKPYGARTQPNAFRYKGDDSYGWEQKDNVGLPRSGLHGVIDMEYAVDQCSFACIRVFVQNRGFGQEEIVQTCETQNSS